MIVATFSIRFARSAKRSAESVSSALSIAGEALHSITVTELPPSESCSSRVSFESRSVAARAKVVNRKSVSTVRKEGAGRLEGGGQRSGFQRLSSSMEKCTGHVAALLLSEGRDHVPERREGDVDARAFLEPLARRARPLLPL